VQSIILKAAGAKAAHPTSSRICFIRLAQYTIALLLASAKDPIPSRPISGACRLGLDFVTRYIIVARHVGVFASIQLRKRKNKTLRLNRLHKTKGRWLSLDFPARPSARPATTKHIILRLFFGFTAVVAGMATDCFYTH